jgi:hypothetical protein
MTRAWRERVCDWPALLADVWYLMRATSLEKSSAPPAVRVQLAFLDAEQAGRVHVALLPLPVRPAGQLTGDFFIAAGTDIAAGGTVTPKAVVGKTVRAQFARDTQGGWQIERFAAPEEA